MLQRPSIFIRAFVTEKFPIRRSLTLSLTT
jgi:hypothetical protein